MKICPGCDTRFETIYPNKVYCSAACREKNKRQRPEEKAQRAEKQKKRRQGYQERMKVDAVFASLFKEKANERNRKHYNTHYEEILSNRRTSEYIYCSQCGEKIRKNKSGICKFCKSAAKEKRIAEKKALAKYPFFKFFYQRYLARKSGLRADFTRKDWNVAVEHFDNRCAYCGREAELHQDHFIPSTRGGGYTKKNIVPSCQPCNSRKGNRMPADFLPVEKYLEIVRYFNGL